jgi:curved DNA-binding protein CbpA
MAGQAQSSLRVSGCGRPQMSVPDPYKVLQVDSEAEDEVIEAAYKRLARKYHPDVAQGPDAEQRMVRINQAWEMLRDPIRRAAVDRARLRAATTAARVAAADAHAYARMPDAPSGSGVPADGWSGGRGGVNGRARQPLRPASPQPSWPLPGMQPTGGSFIDPVDRGGSNWGSGRSSVGGGFDATTMGTAQGEGAAGPPPGNPSGTVLGFGRYAGWSLGEIARADAEYLEWLDRMPIGRTYQHEIDLLLRRTGHRSQGPDASQTRGLFRRR